MSVYKIQYIIIQISVGHDRTLLVGIEGQRKR